MNIDRGPPSGYYSTWPAVSPRPEVETRREEIRNEVIAVSRRRASARALPDERRDALTALAVDIMLTLDSPWNGEGPLRAGLRSRLCLNGWDWRDADGEADTIVQAALRQLGCTTRPTWEMGQRGYARSSDIENTRCVFCGDKLGDDSPGAYCSASCRTMRKNFLQAQRYDDLVNLENAARAAGRREPISRAAYLEECKSRRTATAQIKVPCAHCGQPFNPGWRSRARKYCSRACVYGAQRDQDIRSVEPRECEQCGKWFEVRSNGSAQRYCSKACYGSAQIRPGREQQCEVCSTIFRVAKPQRTCSRRCAWILRRRGSGSNAADDPGEPGDPDESRCAA